MPQITWTTIGFLYLFAQGEANNVFLASEEVVDQQNVRYPSFLPFFIHFIIPSPFLVSLPEVFFFLSTACEPAPGHLKYADYSLKTTKNISLLVGL